MKKNFFKKLSFVLALAMIVSVIAPAAGAFAAAAPSINVATRTLTLGETNEYDFHVDNKVKGSTYKWSSSDTSVATVDSVGLTTAVTTGTTKISVVIKKKGAKTITSTATVTVKDNIKSLTITNLPKDNTLAVGVENDFNRTFTTFGSSTTKTTSVTRWVVTDDKDAATTNATISDSGVFKATAAGTYKIKALAFQSKSKYEDWKTSASSSLVKATSEAVTVTVAPSIVKTAQVDSDTFTVEFDTDMSKSDIATAGILYQVIAGKLAITGTEKIKKVSFDTSGKIVTVDTFATFTQGNDYSFVYGKLTGNFTAAKADLANIKTIAFNDFNVDCTPGTGTGFASMLPNVVAYNSDNVAIYSSADVEFTSRLTFTYGGELGKGAVSGSNAYVYAVGNTIKITAKFEAAVYDATSKTYKTVTASDDAIATGIKADTAVTKETLQYTAPLASNTASETTLTYSATDITIAAGDSNKIYTKYTLNNATTTTLYDKTGAVFTYKTTDADKLIINGNYLFASTTGKVTVIVYNGTTAVGSFDVTIVAARSFAAPTVDVSALTVGNNIVDTTGSIGTVTLVDTLNTSVNATSAVVTVQNAPLGTVANPTVNPTVTASIATAGKVIVTAKGHNGVTPATPGVYNFKVTITALGSSKEVFFTIYVVDATTVSTGANAVSYYAVELSKTAIEVKGLTDTDISIDVFGYNTAGVKVSKLAPTAYTISVKNSAGTEVATSSSIIPVVNSASGSALTSYPAGTYVITATAIGTLVPNRVAGQVFATNTLTVTDATTTTFAVASTAPTAATVADVYAAVKAAYDLVLNGTTVSAADEANIQKINFSKGATVITDINSAVVAGDSVYVSTIIYRQANADGSYTDYTFTINKSFTIK